MQKLKSTKYLGMGAVVVGASLLATIGAKANPITIYGTGQNASGLALADGTVDSHYNIVASSGIINTNANPQYLGTSTTFAITNNPAWLANAATGTSGTKWISYKQGTANGGAPGMYTYRTTFDLTGLNAGTAQLTGSWAVDNQGLDILINGASTGYMSPSYNSLAGFNITSGFKSGVNTLDFIVNNFNDGGGNSPTGLRVNVSGTAAAVPEPGTMSLMALGLASLAAAKRRKKQNEEAGADDSAL